MTRTAPRAISLENHTKKVHMSKTLHFNGSQRFTYPIKEHKRYSLFELCKSLGTIVNRCESLQSHLRAYILLTTSRKEAEILGFYVWQLFPRTVALSTIACVIWDFCCRVQSLGLLSAKSLRQISRIKVYTDVNLGLYFTVLSYKHDLLFSNVSGLNLCLARPLNIAAQ